LKTVSAETIKNRCKSCYGGNEKRARNCKIYRCTLWQYGDALEAPLKALMKSGKQRRAFNAKYWK
jgi:hypothetical protein